ncbi:hypothetical protein Tco_0018568 [Tanacetum coccineum]
MIDADYEVAARLQAQEQEELTIEEKSKLFVKLMDKRKKHFARLRTEEQRRKPPTKAQKRNQMCTYLKNMAGFTHSQLKNKSFDEVQKDFDKTIEGKIGYFQIIRADGSSRRPEEAYERVLWGDLKVMFKPDVESDVWRNLQGHKVTKKYPLTPATITTMLNKKLQADHWNEMCYQLLKLMTKLVKNPGSSASCVYREGNRHLHAGRERVSIVKRNSYTDAGCKALGRTI